VTSCFQKLGILLMRGNSEIMLNKTFPLVFVLLSDTSAGNSALHYPNQEVVKLMLRNGAEIHNYEVIGEIFGNWCRRHKEAAVSTRRVSPRSIHQRRPETSQHHIFIIAFSQNTAWRTVEGVKCLENMNFNRTLTPSFP